MAPNSCLREITDRETLKRYRYSLMNRSASLMTIACIKKPYKDKEITFSKSRRFVYTLPNIVNRRNSHSKQNYGRNFLFVSETFSRKLYQLSVTAFTDPDIKRVICGWTDYELNNCDVFLLLLSNENKEGIPFTINNINNLYK